MLRTGPNNSSSDGIPPLHREERRIPLGLTRSHTKDDKQKVPSAPKCNAAHQPQREVGSVQQWLWQNAKPSHQRWPPVLKMEPHSLLSAQPAFSCSPALNTSIPTPCGISDQLFQSLGGDADSWAAAATVPIHPVLFIRALCLTQG